MDNWGQGTCTLCVSRLYRRAIGKPVQVRFTPAVPPHPALEPEISDIVEVDIGKERREHRALRRTDLRGLHEPVFHDPCLYHPVDQA
jgi:hypothetical protein